MVIVGITPDTRDFQFYAMSNCWRPGISFFLSNRSSETVHNAPPFKNLKLKLTPFKTVPELSYRPLLAREVNQVPD